MKMRSTGPSEAVFDVKAPKIEYQLEDKCPDGYTLRPHIVWFGEMVPELERAIPIVEQADIILVIGTSLQVYPAASLINFAKSGAIIYYIDPKPASTSSFQNPIKVIADGASNGMKQLYKELIEQEDSL